MSKRQLLKKLGKVAAEESLTVPLNRLRGSIGVGQKILNKTTKNVDDLSLSMVGKRFTLPTKGAIVAGASIIGSAQGINDVVKNNMGSPSNEVYKATPTIPDYDESYGATGDLVFDLYDLRKG